MAEIKKMWYAKQIFYLIYYYYLLLSIYYYYKSFISLFVTYKIKVFCDKYNKFFANFP